MSRETDERRGTGPNLREWLEACGISPEDYDDLIQALFLAAPKDPAAHAVTRLDTRGSPLPITVVGRFFDSATVFAEDRGAVYAVWVSRIDRERATEEVVGFAEFPWGQR